MERLTEKGYEYQPYDFMEDGMHPYMNRLSKYEDTGLAPEDILSALELANIWAALRQLEKYEKLQPIDDWHEDMSDCLFWKLPIQEPPYCGTPLDGNWDEGYYTHFTRLPIPKENK